MFFNYSRDRFQASKEDKKTPKQRSSPPQSAFNHSMNSDSQESQNRGTSETVQDIDQTAVMAAFTIDSDSDDEFEDIVNMELGDIVASVEAHAREQNRRKRPTWGVVGLTIVGLSLGLIAIVAAFAGNKTDVQEPAGVSNEASNELTVHASVADVANSTVPFVNCTIGDLSTGSLEEIFQESVITSREFLDLIASCYDEFEQEKIIAFLDEHSEAFSSEEIIDFVQSHLPTLNTTEVFEILDSHLQNMNTTRDSEAFDYISEFFNLTNTSYLHSSNPDNSSP